MKKILVANRGEIACRVISSAKKLGLKTVAVYSEADSNAKHVANADEAICIGAPQPKESYLRLDRIISAAIKTKADSIHPGYGFLSENFNFSQAVIDTGINWIGPKPKVIKAMGDKERARAIAKTAMVPVLEGSKRFLPNQNTGLIDAAQNIGFPLLVKASAGGGGIGMRRVDKLSDLEEVVKSTQNMAEKSFGNGAVYLEKLIENPRHIEIQIFGLSDKRCVHFFERECSIQRRFQKIVEETPSTAINPSTRSKMCNAAVSLAKQQNYLGAGTVEFILAPDGRFYFLEMNTRIQVEHPITEMITGHDLVAHQLNQANPDITKFTLEQKDIKMTGHAIECRIYAENPEKNFMPTPGILEIFTPPPEIAGVRVDTGYQEGDKITYFYDPMIAKLITHGFNREDSIKKMLTALKNFRIEGLSTNTNFLKRVIDHQSFRSGDTHTSFVDKYRHDLILD